MNIHSIPVVSVSYNSAELIEDLLRSFRAHYPNPVTIVDGSSAQHVAAIEAVCQRYADVRFIHFDYNIHHGPGMAWAFENLHTSGPVLVLDSDIFVLRGGFLESMVAALKPGMYGVGSISYVNEGGFDIAYSPAAIRYLHPACMLCNAEVVRMWPLPVKHGAPLTPAMLALHNAAQHSLIADIEWLTADFSPAPAQNYLRHDWQGTVKRTGGYHLEEWEKAAQEIARVRQLVLSLMPADAHAVVEIGANDGALARAYKAAHAQCSYTSLALDAHRNGVEKGARDAVVPIGCEGPQAAALDALGAPDCWVLDQALERLVEPAQLLSQLRQRMAPDASLVAVIPNAQHWSVQAKLCIGDFRYAQAGLLHSSHLRWFTRATIFELFQQAGFQIVQGYPVIHDRIANPVLVEAIKAFARSVGAKPELALEDSQAVQYVVKAVPA